VLDAADVESTGSQALASSGRKAASFMRRAVAEKLPRRIDERVHCVGLAPGRAAALRAGRVTKRSWRSRATFLTVSFTSRGSSTGRSCRGRRRCVLLTVDDGRWRPSSADAKCPVAEAIDRRARPKPRARRSAHVLHGLVGREAVEGPELTRTRTLRKPLRGSASKRSRPSQAGDDVRSVDASYGSIVRTEVGGVVGSGSMIRPVPAQVHQGR